MIILCRLVSSRFTVQRRTVTPRWVFRTYSDKSDKPHSNTTQKQVMVHGSASEDRMRVRRARPVDVPRVLRFVQERATTMWATSSPLNPAVAQLVLKDYVARALAQGHSLVAEQLESKKGWTHIRGVAVSSSVCPWDAALLRRWSQCVLCPAGKKLLNVAAISLDGPGLHDKYKVQNILQVILIVPTDHPKCDEIILNLLKHSIERGQQVGFPLIRFDVTNPVVAKILEDMHLKKEWELNLNSSPPEAEKKKDNDTQNKNLISVYTVQADLTGKKL